MWRFLRKRTTFSDDVIFVFFPLVCVCVERKLEVVYSTRKMVISHPRGGGGGGGVRRVLPGIGKAVFSVFRSCPTWSPTNNRSVTRCRTPARHMENTVTNQAIRSAHTKYTTLYTLSTMYTLYSVQYTVHIVYNVHIVQCTIHCTHCLQCTIHCKHYLCCTHCTEYTTLYTLYRVYYTVHIAQSTLHCTHCTLYSTMLTLYTVHTRGLFYILLYKIGLDSFLAIWSATTY